MLYVPPDSEDERSRKLIKVPLSLLVDIGSLLYALANVFHPDWLIRSNFRLRKSDNLHKDSHQNSWIYPRVKKEISIVLCVM